MNFYREAGRVLRARRGANDKVLVLCRPFDDIAAARNTWFCVVSMESDARNASTKHEGASGG